MQACGLAQTDQHDVQLKFVDCAMTAEDPSNITYISDVSLYNFYVRLKRNREQ